MRQYMIVTPSVTNALKGRDALRRIGIPARIERKTRPGGCGYGIVTGADIKKVESVLNGASVKVLEILDL